MNTSLDQPYHAHTTPNVFRARLRTMQFGGWARTAPHIAANTTPANDLPSDARYFLALDMLSGFGIHGDELIAVWSAERGRGDAIVRAAKDQGAARLDCFDGFLPALYGRHGFIETARVPNWEAGGPDVVYMARVGSLQGCAVCGSEDTGRYENDDRSDYVCMDCAQRIDIDGGRVK